MTLSSVILDVELRVITPAEKAKGLVLVYHTASPVSLIAQIIAVVAMGTASETTSCRGIGKGGTSERGGRTQGGFHKRAP